MKTITSRQNPAVRAFRELAQTPDVTGARVLLDGAHLVRDAIDAGVDVELAAIAAAGLDGRTEESALAHVLEVRGVDVMVVPDQVFSAMSPVRTPSGIVAIGRRRPATVADVCRHAAPFVVVGIDIQDPGNIGAVLRVAEAAGATGAFVSSGSANPFSWKALRGSMASTLRLAVVSGLTAAEIVDHLRSHRIRSVAAVPRGGVDPDQVHWAGGVAIVVGGEGPGLSDTLVAACDDRVTIPMAPRVESLNVAVAAGVLLYAARRHRSLPG